MTAKKELDLISSVPPNKFERNEFGLLKGINYVFDEDGYVDWLKMLKLEHFAPDKNKTAEKDVSKVPESDLLVLLPGLKYLANIRGYNSVDYYTIGTDNRRTCVKCTISWIPNYETEGRIVSFSSLADACTENTNGNYASLYLSATAENRAFNRCVRNFLKIKNVSKEEIGHQEDNEEDNEPKVSSPLGLLKELMERRPISFESLKAKLIEEKREDAKAWESINDIPKPTILELINRLKKVVSGK